MIQCAFDMHSNKDLRVWQATAMDSLLVYAFSWTSNACCLQFLCLHFAGIRQDVREGYDAGTAHHQKNVQWYSTMSKMPNAYRQNRRVQQNVVWQLWSVALLPLWQGDRWPWPFLVGGSKTSMMLPWHTFYARLVWQSITKSAHCRNGSCVLFELRQYSDVTSRGIWKKFKLAAGLKFNWAQSVVLSDALNVAREISR